MGPIDIILFCPVRTLFPLASAVEQNLFELKYLLVVINWLFVQDNKLKMFFFIWKWNIENDIWLKLCIEICT